MSLLKSFIKFSLVLLVLKLSACYAPYTSLKEASLNCTNKNDLRACDYARSLSEISYRCNKGLMVSCDKFYGGLSTSRLEEKCSKNNMKACFYLSKRSGYSMKLAMLWRRPTIVAKRLKERAQELRACEASPVICKEKALSR